VEPELFPMYCRFCRKPISGYDMHCPNCGQLQDPFVPREIPSKRRSSWLRKPLLRVIRLYLALIVIIVVIFCALALVVTTIQLGLDGAPPGTRVCWQWLGLTLDYRILFWLTIGLGIFISIICASLWFWVLLDCLNNEPNECNGRTVWVLVILFLQGVGAMIYYMFRRPARIREQTLESQEHS